MDPNLIGIQIKEFEIDKPKNAFKLAKTTSTQLK
jgi:hypothetical protein